MEVLVLESLSDADRRELLRRTMPDDAEVRARVAAILGAVREHGDDALREFSERYDGVRLAGFRIPPEEMRRALSEISPEQRAALETARSQIEAFHRLQGTQGYRVEPLPGLTLGQRLRPFRRVGIYVPKNLPSTLLMASIPARIAGVRELAVCSPPQPDGSVPASIRAAAALLEISEIYALGGAHAIAALAYGTSSIPAVEKIVGPGNAYVTAAKLLVRDEVGIDLLAGPSEVLLLVESIPGLSETTLAEWALAELVAQLEHGPGTSALLLTNLPNLARNVAAALSSTQPADRHVAVLSYTVRNRAVDFINQYAPEHLGLWVEDAERVLDSIENAGSVFLGPWSPVALGDYASGPNHILPTAGTARFQGGLTVESFQKRVQFQRATPAALHALAPAAVAIAHMEGMTAHAASLNLRLKGGPHEK